MTKSQIRKSLEGQLEAKGLNRKDHAVFFERVDKYMLYVDIAEALLTDIKDRGVSVEWSNSKDQHGVKQNDSVNTLIRVNKSMNDILTLLALKPPKKEVEEDDEIDFTL